MLGVVIDLPGQALQRPLAELRIEDLERFAAGGNGRAPLPLRELMALAEAWPGCERIGFDGSSDDVFAEMIAALRSGVLSCFLTVASAATARSVAQRVINPRGGLPMA